MPETCHPNYAMSGHESEAMIAGFTFSAIFPISLGGSFKEIELSRLSSAKPAKV